MLLRWQGCGHALLRPPRVHVWRCRLLQVWQLRGGLVGIEAKSQRHVHLLLLHAWYGCGAHVMHGRCAHAGLRGEAILKQARALHMHGRAGRGGKGVVAHMCARAVRSGHSQKWPNRPVCGC